MKKRNQTFQYLEALAILMVIDDHMSTRIGIFSSVFPYNSFYMPLFVFISGYFYKEQKIFPNIKHKVKHLLIPYLIWAVVGEIIAYILMRLGIVNWYVSPFSKKSIFQLFFIDSLSSITGASWFVIMLFWVSIGYNILKKIFKLNKKEADYLFLAAIVLIGILDIKLCISGYNQRLSFLFVLRSIWYLQFYHIGRMFRLYWEKHVKKWRLLHVCSVCVAINVVLLCIKGDAINFYSTSNMGSFSSCWLPLLTSMTGFLFYYKLMQFISSKVNSVKIINFIAENTFTIMECHLMFVNIPNFYAYYQFVHGNKIFSNFPANTFVTGAWLRYSPNTRLIGFFCGLLGSLIIAYLINIIKCKNLKRRAINL